jgi:hypothetical protein
MATGEGLRDPALWRVAVVAFIMTGEGLRDPALWRAASNNSVRDFFLVLFTVVALIVTGEELRDPDCWLSVSDKSSRALFFVAAFSSCEMAAMRSVVFSSELDLVPDGPFIPDQWDLPIDFSSPPFALDLVIGGPLVSVNWDLPIDFSFPAFALAFNCLRLWYFFWSIGDALANAIDFDEITLARCSSSREALKARVAIPASSSTLRDEVAEPMLLALSSCMTVEASLRLRFRFFADIFP